jgi:hypothetical protein
MPPTESGCSTSYSKRKARECKKGGTDLKTHTAIWCPPYPRIDSSKPIGKRNFLSSPTSICELVHKTNCLHKPPKPVDFSLEKKEGKNEKNLYIHNSSNGTDGLYVISGSDI